MIQGGHGVGVSILQILGCGFLTLVAWLVLTQYHSSLSIFVVLAFGVAVLGSMASQLQHLIQTILAMSVQAGVNTAYFTILLKMVGIAWLAECMCQICRDAGSAALAVKLEFAAKLSILFLIVPVLGELLETIITMIA